MHNGEGWVISWMWIRDVLINIQLLTKYQVVRTGRGCTNCLKKLTSYRSGINEW